MKHYAPEYVAGLHATLYADNGERHHAADWSFSTSSRQGQLWCPSNLPLQNYVGIFSGSKLSICQIRLYIGSDHYYSKPYYFEILGEMHTSPIFVIGDILGDRHRHVQ